MMKAIRLGDLLKNVSVTKNPDKLITKVTTDSRDAGPGCVFVGIKGDRFDGSDFATDALANGAEAVVVSRMLDTEGEQILVKDTKDALIAMAGNYRDMFDPVVAGITGSVGKTTTKEMTAAIFSCFGKTLKNEGNKNNEIGVPETLFSMEDDTRLAVVEMGMNGIGDISKLTHAVRPRVAAITSIGVSHMELLGSRENILKAKLEIAEGLPGKDGVLVLNGDDDMLMSAVDSIENMTVTFGIDNTDCDVVARDIMSRVNATSFTISDRINGNFKASIPGFGNHQIYDALAAYTIATRVGLDPQRSAEGLANYIPAGMRQKIVDFKNITVVEDCYNANPDSMKASLNALSSLPNDGLKIAVLGDMLELGHISEQAHKEIGLLAGSLGIDILLCIGQEMKACASAAVSAGVPSVEHFDNIDDLSDYLVRTVHPGDAVVFKASRAIALENAIARFYENY